MSVLLRRDVLRYASYTHSVVYCVLLWAAISDREAIVSVLGWVHGVGWIVMSLLCSGAITLLFRTRDRLLIWQKGVVKW